MECRACGLEKTATHACKKPGDPVDIGDLLGHPMEPYERWARVTGWIKKGYDEAGNEITDWKSKFILRVFQPDDGEFPTGEYRTGRLIVPLLGMDA